MPVQAIELATESIPGCVLQIFVVLTNANNMGIGALISIAISALATGFTSAKIAFDKDLDTQGRKNQPNFYGKLFPAVDIIVVVTAVANIRTINSNSHCMQASSLTITR